MKIGRNQPCWCGSGKKFKKCHWGRTNQPRANPWDHLKAIESSFSARYCMCPPSMSVDCSSKIVKAHTIPKRGTLQRIEEQGHVLSLHYPAAQLFKSEGKPDPWRVGLRKASTFTGFCSHHDNKLFEPVEKGQFAATAEQCFLVAYRSVARELYTKRAANKSTDAYAGMDAGTSPSMQASIQALTKAFTSGLETGESQIQSFKDEYDAELELGLFNNTRSCVIEFDDHLPIAFSGTIYPEFDFEGRALQSYESAAPMEMLCLNIVAGGSGTFAVITWLELGRGSKIPTDFVTSLVGHPGRISECLVRLGATHLENTFFKESWWHSLESKQQSVIKNLMLSGTPIRERLASDLVPDGSFSESWKIKRIAHR